MDVKCEKSPPQNLDLITNINDSGLISIYTNSLMPLMSLTPFIGKEGKKLKTKCWSDDPDESPLPTQFRSSLLVMALVLAKLRALNSSSNQSET